MRSCEIKLGNKTHSNHIADESLSAITKLSANALIWKDHCSTF